MKLILLIMSRSNLLFLIDRMESDSIELEKENFGALIKRNWSHAMGAMLSSVHDRGLNWSFALQNTDCV